MIHIRKREINKKVFSGFTIEEYLAASDSIIYNEEKGEIHIGERTFTIDTSYPVVKGSKKRVFHLIGKSPFILKVVRDDTLNEAAVYKAMFESIAFEDVLRGHSIPHAKIIEIDPETPKRYVIQEGLPKDSPSAATLIRENALTKEDVKQIASVVNAFETEGIWQVDTNPFNWYRVKKDDGTTQMTYVDGKVYEYEKSWEFKKVGLLQWLDPVYVSDASIQSAQIPKVKEYENVTKTWHDTTTTTVVQWWKKYLDKTLQPTA